MKVVKQKTKTLKTRDNGRSADAISPNFIYGCLGGCMKSYCYVGRYNYEKVYINENTYQILDSINNWVKDKPWPKVPNQTDSKYYTIDIGCSTDVALMSNHYNWNLVFAFFNHHPMIKSTFATKYPTRFKPDNHYIDAGKHRIRVSLMPQVYSDVLEPNTDIISDRIKCIPKLQKHMEVHINFSPIIYTDGWLQEYEKLFQEIKAASIDVECECIFLTYHLVQKDRNCQKVNDICWRPDIQEFKDSQYAPHNIRYKHNLKDQMVKDFTNLYSQYFDVSKIRYIF